MTEAFGLAPQPVCWMFAVAYHPLPLSRRGVSRALDSVSVMAIALPRSTIG